MRDEPIHLLRGTIRWRIVLLCSGWEDRVYVGSAEAVPFQSYSTSEDARAYIDGILAGESLPCFAEALSEVEGGVEEAPALHSSSHTVSSKDARLAPYCNRVPRLRTGTRPGPSLAQKRRSFRMTTLKVLYWPG